MGKKTDARTAKAARAEAAPVKLLTERLIFFFSNANLRQDRWMRQELENKGCVSLDTLLRFKTIQQITLDKDLLARAAMGKDKENGERVKKLIVFSKERGEVSRVTPFDWKTMADGSRLSLYVKNIPMTSETSHGNNKESKKENEKDKTDHKDGRGGKNHGKKKQSAPPQKSRPRYAVDRDEIKTLFEPYGRVGIVTFRYGRKEDKGRCQKGYNNRGYGNRGESYPLGVAIVEFEDEAGIEKACKELEIHVDSKHEMRFEKKDANQNAEGSDVGASMKKTVLEIKGNKLVVERMRPQRHFHNQDRNSSKKRSHDNEDNQEEEEVEEAAEVSFEPVTVDWEKGCVISLTGLSTSTCDRESIREAVSGILGVSMSVRTSGLYVDYNRGATTANLRLTESKPDQMKELVEKLNDGSVLIAKEKVGNAKILEGDEEDKYWKDFIAWLNNRKRMKKEKAHARKRQKI